MFRRTMIAAAALFVSNAAGHAGDWAGLVKVEASYDFTADSSSPELNIGIDVVYDRPGPQGKAFGTISYQRRAQGIYVQESIYYHALCVGIFNAKNNYSVAGQLVKVIGNPVQQFITFEFDISGKRIGSQMTNTEAAARATCGNLSGVFNSTLNDGYVIVK